MNKTIENARIVEHERISDQIFRMRLHSPEIARTATSGQFVMVRVRDGSDPLLRRPFSFSRIFAADGDFEILYRVTGRGTWILSRLPEGSSASVIGPLGNGFELPAGPGGPLAFIAGGIGIAPLIALMEHAASASPGPNHLFFGARTAAELLPESYFAGAAVRVHFATDDGSFGHRGRVTEVFERLASEMNFSPRAIYSCGPLAMQYHVARRALSTGTPAQLSLESVMGCGIGACLGCALPTFNPGDPESETYVHVCEDGPIFSAGSIKWEKISVQQTAPPRTFLFS